VSILLKVGTLLLHIVLFAHLFHKLGVVKEIGETPRFLVLYGLFDWAGIVCNDGTFCTHGL